MRVTKFSSNRGLVKDDGKPTRSGRYAVRCPLEPVWYRAIEEGTKLGCGMEMLDIAVLCSAQRSIYKNPPEHQRVADTSRSSLAFCPSDHIALANDFNQYMKAREVFEKDPKFDLGSLCDKNSLDMVALEEVCRTRERVGSFLKNVAKLVPTHASVTAPATILKALTIAFCTQTAIIRGKNDHYRTVHENVDARLAPSSCLVGQASEWVVYTDLTMSGGKLYMQTASPVDPRWLLDLPYFEKE